MKWPNFLRNTCRCEWEPACKPGSVKGSHSSGTRVTARLEQPTRIQCGPHHRIPIWSCSGWGLPCRSCYHQRGALLPHLFTLTNLTPKGFSWRSIFCGTFRRLAPPRRYLAPCPMEPGLSSILHRLPTNTMTTETGPRLPGRLPPCQHRLARKRRQVGNSPLIVF